LLAGARHEARVHNVTPRVRQASSKRLALLREMVPGAARVAVLVNPASEPKSRSTARDLQAAARPFLPSRWSVVASSTGSTVETRPPKVMIVTIVAAWSISGRIAITHGARRRRP